MKKVLIITYYWPPSGGAGVQRWLKFVKYLRKYNWEPIVYTALDAEYPVLDPSLQKEVPENIKILRRPIIEPHTLYRKLTGKEERVFSVFVRDEDKSNWKQRLSLYIRANLFIPDARALWIKPSVRFLKKYLQENKVDLIVSTGPPHSMHLIAQKLKKSSKLPWLADFRDPWTTIDFADDLPFTQRSLKQNVKLEERVLKSADRITVVGDFMRDEFATKTKVPIEVITNGFDPDDFKFQEPNEKSTGFTLVHTGSLNNRRNHPALWKAIAKLKKDRPDLMEGFCIKLIGVTDANAKINIADLGLDHMVTYYDYLPHEEVVKEQYKADMLLLLINRFGENSSDFKSAKGTVTGKVFEYLASRKPILAIGMKESQLADILAETGAGVVCGFDEEEEICKFLLNCLNGKFSLDESTNIDAYSREQLTAKMARAFEAAFS